MHQRMERVGAAENWVEIALASPPWTKEQRQRALQLHAEARHLGEVAEALGCSVLTVQAELGIGERRAVQAYRRRRGLAAIDC